jgi:hypothetical protein
VKTLRILAVSFIIKGREKMKEIKVFEDIVIALKKGCLYILVDTDTYLPYGYRNFTPKDIQTLYDNFKNERLFSGHARVEGFYLARFDKESELSVINIDSKFKASAFTGNSLTWDLVDVYWISETPLDLIELQKNNLE